MGWCRPFRWLPCRYRLILRRRSPPPSWGLMIRQIPKRLRRPQSCLTRECRSSPPIPGRKRLSSATDRWAERRRLPKREHRCRRFTARIPHMQRLFHALRCPIRAMRRPKLCRMSNGSRRRLPPCRGRRLRPRCQPRATTGGWPGVRWLCGSAPGSCRCRSSSARRPIRRLFCRMRLLIRRRPDCRPGRPPASGRRSWQPRSRTPQPCLIAHRLRRLVWWLSCR
ncbi:hypothetical protein XINFAN_00449 [Pseudogemmobacter humi]|uniref:Uncharacterized protein n=1 Tax=Pseudogemmobacter humi TaxID=2483812 RepID=A0A3P5WWH6_9RHOB|nr:hypothetical protein XINFAN_00449 [Pseudogemmobacter humi]